MSRPASTRARNKGEDYVWCEPAQECMPRFSCEEYGGGDMGGGIAVPAAGGVVRPDP
jgi:hypothetical protein